MIHLHFRATLGGISPASDFYVEKNKPLHTLRWVHWLFKSVEILFIALKSIEISIHEVRQFPSDF